MSATVTDTAAAATTTSDTSPSSSMQSPPSSFGNPGGFIAIPVIFGLAFIMMIYVGISFWCNTSKRWKKRRERRLVAQARKVEGYLQRKAEKERLKDMSIWERVTVLKWLRKGRDVDKVGKPAFDQGEGSDITEMKGKEQDRKTILSSEGSDTLCEVPV